MKTACELYALGKYNEALSVLEESLRECPDSMRLHAKKGDIHFARMDYVQSVESYARALSANTEDCTEPMAREFIQDKLAQSKCFLGDHAGAVALLRPLVVAHPEEELFGKSYALTLAKSAETIEIADLPGNHDTLGIFLCRNLLAEKRFHDAVRCSGQLLKKYPDTAHVTCCHAEVLFRLTRIDEAVGILEKAVRHQYADIASYETLIAYRLTEGNYQFAREACLTGLFHFPGEWRLLYRLVNLGTNRFFTQKKLFEKLLAFPESYKRMPFDIIPRIFEDYDDSLFPKTEEGEKIREYFDILKEHHSMQWEPRHTIEKITLPKFESHDVDENSPLSARFSNNAVTYTDTRSVRCNVENGCRVVVNQPSIYDYTVFLLGPCLATAGWCDSLTLGSALQDTFNSRSNEKVRVINYGGNSISGIGRLENIFSRLFHSRELNPGDKIFYYAPLQEILATAGKSGNSALDKLISGYAMLRNMLTRRNASLYIGFTPVLGLEQHLTRKDSEFYKALCECGHTQSHKDTENMASFLTNRLTDEGFSFLFFGNIAQEQIPENNEMFWQMHSHYSMILNWPLAEKIYLFLSSPPKMTYQKKLPSFKNESLRWLQDFAFEKFIGNEDIRSWIQETHDAEISNRENVGAIVMNCNPFTLGHRYLVEKALESVETLYLFVVEEDLSQFSFVDRLMLVKEGVRDFGGRVKVVPSGKFIIYYSSKFNFLRFL